MQKIAKRLSVLAGAFLGLATAITANAAVITFDVRIAGGGGKAANITSDNQVVNLELYAVVQNLNNDHADDAFQLAHGSLKSVEGGAPLLGNLTALSLNTPFLDSGLSNGGLVQNLDANGDLEVGSNAPGAVTNFIVTTTGAVAKFGTGAGGTPTEFLLGTFTWTGPGPLPGDGSTSINYELRNKIDGLASSRLVFQGRSDGAAFTYNGGTDAVAGNIAVGAPVVLSLVPEPGSIAVLGLSLLGLAARRRRA